jgi:hypothetical protein
MNIDGVCIGWTGFIDHLYTPLGTIFYISLTHRIVSLVSTSRFLATASAEAGFSAFRTQVLLSQPPVHNSCELTTNWVPGCRPFHTNLLVFSSQADLQMTCPSNWTLSLTNQQLHVTSLSWTADNSLLTTNSLLQTVLLIPSRHGPHRKHRFLCYSPTIPRPLHRNRCLFIHLLHSKGCTVLFEVSAQQRVYKTQ